MPEQEEEVLLELRKSRKAYALEYGCAVVIVGLLLALVVKGVTLKPFLIYAGLIVAGFAVAFSEISRGFVRYKITPTKLVILHGILKQSKKNVYWQPLGFVPDINLKQGRLQRLLDYGTVYITSGGEQNSMEVKDVNNPQYILEYIEHLIEQARQRGQLQPQNKV